DFQPAFLNELQRERIIFECWGHALSYLPMAEYRYYLPQMRRRFDPVQKWEKERLAKYGHLMKPLLDRIRRDGPLSSKDLEKPPASERTEGLSPKPLKTALEMLFWRGEVMVSERRSFQRTFDLTERVLPEGLDASEPSPQEIGRHFTLRALTALGAARLDEIYNYIWAAKRDVLKTAVAELVESGEIIEWRIGEDKRTPYYALKSASQQVNKSESPRLHILSPFDNLIIQRERVRRLFGFDYALECYTTPSKRKFGYYALPILWGDRLVGRLDLKADRKLKTLEIRNLGFEDGFEVTDEFGSALANKLLALAGFVGCERVEDKNVNVIFFSHCH
ncbi:MAG: crosslink repair DNA glycosylase YcaQ family protein, partial [Calditrichota bacterium]